MYVAFLITMLIIFFIILIVYQTILAHLIFKEGLSLPPPIKSSPKPDETSSLTKTNNTSQSKQYHDYDMNNPNNAFILSQQNAGNIAFLKSQIDAIIPLQKEVSDISGNLITLSNQVNQIMLQQSMYASKMIPNNPPQMLETTFNNSSEIIK